jgi:UPF0042 nucleotide-binding protein
VNEVGPGRRVVLVTGLSGAGKTSILHTLEDLGYQAMDNLPIAMISDIVARDSRSLAIGVDARTRDFSSDRVMELMAELQALSVQPELVFATASQEALLRRYTESRRRHPLAPFARVSDGIAAEVLLMAGLREAADALLDTSQTPPAALRRLIESRFGAEASATTMTVALVSFAYPSGLPLEADLVFDARFLRNPHYVADLRGLTGLDPAVAAYVEEDPDYAGFFARLVDLLQLLLPRFVQEGKRYVTIGVGCTGGRHRSVHIVEGLTAQLTLAGWRVSRTHRELARDNSATMPISGDPAVSVSLADLPPAVPDCARSAREA